MAIAIDVSTPVYVPWASGSSITTASFSPPANALLVVFTNNGDNNTAATSISDSLSALTWNGSASVTSNESSGSTCISQIWLGQVGPTAPGALTVTSHYAATAAAGYAMGAVVLTGAAAASSQNGQTQTTKSTSGTPTATISSLTGTNSLILGGVANGTGGGTITPGSGQSDAFNGNTFSSSASFFTWAQYLTGINLSAGISATLNDTSPTAISYAMTMMEILAAPILQIARPIYDIAEGGWV